MNILLAGGTGYLGSHLRKKLHEEGCRVTLVVRKEPDLKSGEKCIYWNDLSSPEILDEKFDAVINLAGKSIRCRDTNKNREKILSSRLETTSALAKFMSATKQKPEVWINASATGFYGESSPPGNTFFAGVCQKWEAAVKAPGVRQVLLRTGVVIGKASPLLKISRLLVWLGLGGRQGSGKQLFSWVHEDDFVSSVWFLLKNTGCEGPYNICAPVPATNKMFQAELRKSLGFPFGISSPEFLIKAGGFITGMPANLVLESLGAKPKKLIDDGFQFAYPSLTEALKASK
jgi:uncharacterized protein